MKGWKRAALVYVAVLFLYALATVAMTWPVAARLNTHLVGDGDDMWVHYWNNWWIKRVLKQGGSPYHTDLLFHPSGVSLLYHNFGWVNIALWLGLEPIIGGVAAYNLVCLLHIPFCGLAMFLLGRHLTRSGSAAFLGGLIYAFWPYRMLDLHHPNMVSTEGFPLLMLVLMWVVQGEKPAKDGIMAGVLVALIGYMRWQLLILAGFMSLVYLCYVLAWERERLCWQTLTGLALAVAVAVVLTSPALFPILGDLITTPSPEGIVVVDVTDGRQEFLAWLLPQYQHPLGYLYSQVFPRYGFSGTRQRYSAFLGHVAIALVLFGATRGRARKKIKLWLGLAALSALFALGYYLRFNDVLHREVPLPYKFAGSFLPLKLLRHPHRFNALLALPVAAMGGYGALELKEWLAQQRWGRRLGRPVVLVPLLGLAILGDYASVPTATVPAQVPAFYGQLAQQPGEFAVVGLPNDRDRIEYHMYWQTVHQRPILGGHVSRVPPEALQSASSIPLLRELGGEAGIRMDLPDISRQLSLLADVKFRYIIIDKHLAKDSELAGWRSYLAIRPRYEDMEVAAYPTEPVVGRDCSIEHELGRGMVLVETGLSTQDIAPDAMLEIEVVWGTTSAPGENLRLELSLVDEERRVGQVERFRISPTWPTQAWPANAIVRDKYAFQIEPWLRAGDQALVARLVRAEDGQPVGQKAEIGTVVMHVPERVFVAPPMERAVEARFGDALRLLGYNLGVGADAIDVTLHWEALRRMDQSYKFFVHLYDCESGELVAQKDVIPYDWQYPTVWWEANEMVSDQVRVPLDEVLSGIYQLAVGVYDAQTGDRLAIHGEGLIVTSEALILQEVTAP